MKVASLWTVSPGRGCPRQRILIYGTAEGSPGERTLMCRDGCNPGTHPQITDSGRQNIAPLQGAESLDQGKSRGGVTGYPNIPSPSGLVEQPNPTTYRAVAGSPIRFILRFVSNSSHLELPLVLVVPQRFTRNRKVPPV